MDSGLFPIQRYLGDEETPKEDDSVATAHLNKLLSKVKEREKSKPSKINDVTSKINKLQLNGSSSHVSRSLEDVSETPPKKKKVKKSKKSEVDLNASVGDNLESQDESSADISKDEVEKMSVDNDEEEEKQENQDLDEDAAKELFPVIGDFKFKKKKKVKRVLPDWLANPSVVSVDLKNLEVSIDDIPGLHEIFKSALKKNNISHFFPVQAQVIPWLFSCAKQCSVLWPSDICVSAPTGSGKTLAYVLPILQGLMGNRTGHIAALVVLPVQDLATQVTSVFRSYITGTGLRVHLSTGGIPLQHDRNRLLKQRLGVGWESQADILVITPGRLVEHLYSTPGFTLKYLQYIVIDEADRIVDNVQNNWLQHVDQHLSVQGCPVPTLHSLKSLPRRPQKLLFSATLSIDPEKLNHLNLFQPRLFTSVVEATKDQGGEGEFIGKFTTPAELQELEVRCTLTVKPLVVYRLISRESWSRVLVFMSSARAVHQLAALLVRLARKDQRVLRVCEISAEVSPTNTKTVLEDFAAGRVDVLVCTDKFARGMDIPNVRYVVSYDIPKTVKGYIHRVGRTGRAGNQGTAVTMVQHTQAGLFKQMLQTAGKEHSVAEVTVDKEELKALEGAFKEALEELKSATKGEEVDKLNREKSMKRAVISTKVFPKKRKHNGSFGKPSKKFKRDKH